MREVIEIEHNFNKQYRKDLILQNIIKDSNFENCSNEILVVNEDNIFCGKDWFLNRGGEITFRQFSRSHEMFIPDELETFVEIENRDGTNTFFEIVQEIDLTVIPLKLAEERCIFSFEIRNVRNQSKDVRVYALIYYCLDGLNGVKLINTVHEVTFEVDATQQIWREFDSVSIIPRAAKRVFIGILAECSTGIDEGFALHLKNMYFGLHLPQNVS